MDKDPYYKAGYTCGEIFWNVCMAIIAGTAIGLAIVYWKWVVLVVLVIILVLKLGKDFYDFNIKGEADVDDD